MLKLEGIAAFVAVVDAGSISEAGRRLGLSKSVISDRLSELERLIGGRLLQRTTRKIALTEDGRAFLDRARRMVQDSAEATAEVAARRGKLVGGMRLSGPVTFGVLHLAPALYPFLQEHPGIDLTLDLDDRFVDVAGEGYDAVVRHGPVKGNGLTALPFSSSRRVFVAAPDYLKRHGTPESWPDLDAHDAIFYANRINDWRFAGAAKSAVLNPRVALRVNNGLVMRDAALAGMGIAMLPTFIVYKELMAGSLRMIDVGAEAEGAELSIIFRKGEEVTAKFQALTRHLRCTFGSPPYWERGLQVIKPQPRIKTGHKKTRRKE